LVQLPSLSECLPVAVAPDVVERAQHILPIGRIVVCPKEPQTPVPIRVNQLVDLPPKVFIHWVHDIATVACSKEIGKTIPQVVRLIHDLRLRIALLRVLAALGGSIPVAATGPTVPGVFYS
jgi:hypothetical protein